MAVFIGEGIYHEHLTDVYLSSITDNFFYHINVSDLQHMTFIKVSSFKFLVKCFKCFIVCFFSGTAEKSASHSSQFSPQNRQLQVEETFCLPV